MVLEPNENTPRSCNANWLIKADLTYNLTGAGDMDLLEASTIQNGKMAVSYFEQVWDAFQVCGLWLVGSLGMVQNNGNKF